MKRVIIYCVVGVSAFAAEYFSFVIMFSIIAAPYTLLVAQSISFSLGLLVSFTGNRFFTFNDTDRTYIHNIRKQIWLYLILAGANLFLSNVIIYILVHGLMIEPLISKLLVMSMVVLWNFFILNKLIFKPKQ